MIYVRLYLSTGDTLKEAERQHHFTCVWLKVFAVFNANMQTTMPAKAWKGPELGMISRRPVSDTQTSPHFFILIVGSKYSLGKYFIVNGVPNSNIPKSG